MKSVSIARKLADFLTTQRYEDLPPRTIELAEMLIASTLASAAVGSTLLSATIVRQLEIERGGKADASVWFSSKAKLPVAAAARVNAMMSDAAASDDSDLRNIVHQGTTACAAALAVGEATGADGKEILAAIVLGYEVTGRMGSALQCQFHAKGFHGCVIAAFAAAVAAARLMKLTAPQMAQAMALTATSVGGLGAAANTSCAREFHAGTAAMAGVEAALAAARGFVAEEHILEARSGFFDVYGEEPDVAAVTCDFGQHWCILTELGIKLMPGGHPYHAVAEAAANAATAGNVMPEEVESIEVARPGFQGFANAHQPTDLIGIAHSAAYFAAAGVVDRRLQLDACVPGKNQSSGHSSDALPGAHGGPADAEPGAIQGGRRGDP
ncbi:MmgE/PrpD family protein [Polaromonas sp. P1(28)-13]|nr:MmgE/PrpD family protein [Polaromonas sp. P1(28)-13]